MLCNDFMTKQYQVNDKSYSNSFQRRNSGSGQTPIADAALLLLRALVASLQEPTKTTQTQNTNHARTRQPVAPPPAGQAPPNPCVALPSLAAIRRIATQSGVS